MKLPIILLLSALVSLAGAWTIDDDGGINTFIWPQHSKDLSSFSSRQNISFNQPYFEIFSRTIGEELKNMENLSFYGGNVTHIYLKQSIVKLVISSSNTKSIQIDPDEDYAINQLIVVGCKLTTIPRNTKLLKRLEELNLSVNEIEHVKMSDFNELKNLNYLSLDGNAMKTLSSESTIHLPKLREINIAHNYLQEINVCSWDMPSLEEFDLYRNKLKFVVNLLDQFPKLKEIAIFGNPLVCPWKDNLVKSLESKKISLRFGDATCNPSDETPVPIECPMVYSLSNQLSNKIELLEQRMKKSNDENQSLKQTVATLTDRLQQMAKKSNDENQSLTDRLQQMARKSNEDIQSLTDRLQQMAKKSNDENQSLKQTVATLTNQQTELRHSIDDLTEAFYRYALEKEGEEK